MKKVEIKRKNKLLDLNKVVFPHLIGISYLFIVLESYKYVGFLRKYILVDSRFFLVLSIISVLLIFYQKLRDKNYKEGDLEKLVVNLNSVLFLPLVVLYIIMVVLNAKNYPNYVFATYHIQPQNFINLVYLSFTLLTLSSRFSKRLNLEDFTERLEVFFSSKTGDQKERFSLSNKKNRTAGDKLFLLVIASLLLFYFVNNFIKVSIKIFKDFTFIATHFDSSREDKMVYGVGELFYKYVNFIKDNTPDDSIILIPPQSYPWPQTGNGAYMRYFLYPRKLVNGKEKEAGIDIKKVDYVLIDYGESNFSEHGHTNTWPKFDVAGEYKIIWDPETNNFWKDDNGYYKYSEDEANNLEKWGLIKVKKE